MKDKLKHICEIAREILKNHGLNIIGLHYFIAPPEERFQKRQRGISICFDATTSNPLFFGREYENWRRIKLIDLAYEFLEDTVAKFFPDHEIYLDIMVHLKRPVAATGEPAFQNLKLDLDTVDVTQNNQVYFVELNKLLEKGEIEEGCTLDIYCKRYGLKHVLKHGWHCIAPDVASVEVLEAAIRSRKITSVLEIGGGVGTLAAAAQKHGIKDLTFVDLSQDVCNYLRQNFPYPVIQKSGLEFCFDRHWDFVSMGMPYELNWLFLEAKGKELANHCDIAVFQSGDMAFFDFEHNWISGCPRVSNWPWWHEKQTITRYFPISFSKRIQWQIALLGTKNIRETRDLTVAMEKQGFKDIDYQYVRLN